jgi:ABC-type bacteriocin/lantibiotic exporter with double-glycine peptidase domain
VLTGLLPSYGGTLAYDNVSARDLHRGQLRELIAVNESEVTLFSGTLEENVSLGRPGVTVNHVLRAIEEVGLSESVQRLPDGLATRIGADASRLPSNVERKIALARSLAGRPRLLVFDEFFHHLEPAYKRQVIDRCIDCPAPWTVLGVSHDPVFLAACHRIYVLGDGRFIREGTYDELLTDPYFNGVLLARREPAAFTR